MAGSGAVTGVGLSQLNWNDVLTDLWPVPVKVNFFFLGESPLGSASC